MMGCCLSLELIKEKGLDFDNFCKLAYCNGAKVVSYRASERQVRLSNHEFNLLPGVSRNFAMTLRGLLALKAKSLLCLMIEMSWGWPAISALLPATIREATRVREIPFVTGVLTFVVLLLDIVRDRHPPLWIPTSVLYNSLLPLDPDTGKPRGYFILSKSDTAPTVCLTTGRDK